MKLVYSENSKKKRTAPEGIAGFLAAFLVNVFIVWLTSQTLDLNLEGSLRNYITILPWIINGLFLLFSMLILPRFALGYLLGIALIIAVPLLGAVFFVAGCLLLLAGMATVDDPTWWADKEVILMFIGLIGPIIVGAIIIGGLVMLYRRAKEDE